jgi:hypothetical protein
VVDSPTRIINNSKTLIDNFLLFGFVIGTEVYYSNLDCKITDHNALILGIKLLKRKKEKVNINTRPFNKKLITNFNSNFKKDFISKTCWHLNKLLKVNEKFFVNNFDYHALESKIENNKDIIDEMFHLFSATLLNIQNTWFPIITRDIKNNLERNWFNNEIKLLKKKNKLYKIWKKYGNTNPSLKINCLNAKNECTKPIRKAKNNIILKNLSNLGKDSKSKWKFLNKTLNKYSSDTNLIPNITFNNVNYCENEELANIFNKEYTIGIFVLLTN